jgi:ribosomal protein L10
MKSDSELVDDFIEGLASGAIESDLRKHFDQYTDKGFDTIVECTDAIEAYRLAEEPSDKKAKARIALTQILHNRIIGVYVNNPSQERLALMKTENEALSRENGELKEQISGYLETIKRFKSELAGRGAIA